jgi:hypothetical protein
MKTSIILSAMLLTGCVMATPFISPSGATAFDVRCDYAAGLAACYNKAAETCGGPYHIAETYQQNVSGFVSNGRSFSGFSGGANHLMVECESPHAMPAPADPKTTALIPGA